MKIFIKGVWYKIILENGVRVYENIFCKCGCGGRIPVRESHKRFRYIPEFIPGHNQKGKHWNLSKETRKNQSKAKLGEKNGMYGKTGEEHPFFGKHHTQESIDKIKQNHPDYSGKNNPFSGKHHTKKSIEKIRKTHYIDGYGNERHNAKKRDLGFTPLNHKTTISNTQHHLDNEKVIFEPKELHNMCVHSGHLSKNKERRLIANLIAIAWMTVQDKLELNFDYMKFYKQITL